jgi:hypothetical protein
MAVMPESNFILKFFPALVSNQTKNGMEYLECLVVIDRISILISCRPKVDSSCCMVNAKDFDLRIPFLNVHDIRCGGLFVLFSALNIV